MASKSNTKLKKVYNFLDESFKIKANSIIVTIPGLGYSHILKQYCHDRKINYINDLSFSSGIRNIVDVNLGNNIKEFRLIDKFFRVERTIKPKNTFIFTVDNPHIIQTPEYIQSEISRHVYRLLSFGSWDDFEIKDFIDEQGIKVGKDEFANIMTLSGGIPRIVKFLIYNKELINESVENYVQRSDFKKLIEPTIEVVAMCSLQELKSLNFITNDDLNSKILSWYFSKGGYRLNSSIDLIVQSDLSFKENGVLSDSKLTKFEKDVLEFSISNSGVIQREKIAELKWKDDSYESFSDQAINQAVTRLNKKLKFYKIKSIPKVGYKLTTQYV